MWLIAIVLILLLCVGPVMIGARVMGAQHSGFLRCLGALILASIVSAVAVRLFHGLAILGIFGTAFAYMIVLGTTYLRGLAIAVIQYLILILVGVVLFFTGLAAVLGMSSFMHSTTPNAFEQRLGLTPA